MDSGRLPSFLSSLCLHLAIAVLVIWWPASQPVYPDPLRGALVSGLVTLGKEGKAVPGSKQEIPESRKGREDAGQTAQPATPPPPPEPKPEVKPVEKKPEVKPQPDPEATPIPKEPEKKIEKKPEEKKPEPKPEEKKPEPKPETKKPDPKPETKKPEAKPEEKKPETKPTEKKPEAKKDDLASVLADLGKQDGKSGTADGKRGTAAAGKGTGRDLSSALGELGKQVGGAGDDASGRGPGGRGGDGMGVQGAYLDVIQSRVKSNWSWPGRADRKKYSTLVNIQIDSTGQITNARILRSSGDAPYDSSVMRALNLTRQLEPPPNPELMNVDIEFAF